MKCDQIEENLVLMVHGEAKGVPHLKARLHVLCCRRCRNRLAEYYVLSQGLARDLQNPRMGVRKVVLPSVVGLAALCIAVMAATIAAVSIGAYNTISASSATQACDPAANNHPVSSKKVGDHPTIYRAKTTEAK